MARRMGLPMGHRKVLLVRPDHLDHESDGDVYDDGGGDDVFFFRSGHDRDDGASYVRAPFVFRSQSRVLSPPHRLPE